MFSKEQQQMDAAINSIINLVVLLKVVPHVFHGLSSSPPPLRGLKIYLNLQ